ncbi:hypothetical protein [Desulfatibacillum aliphaticivorans]|uniref:hypothetical protein n=1 Tax=Desulfatibacillum aliphaticivorans TaxID=218208 RepID=UPI0003F6174D|nr:hypothetical protein [Desulfatibacillum aliphaticivorans]
MKFKILFAMLIAILPALASPVFGGTPEQDFTIIKISPQDGNAVIQFPGRGLQLVKTGDRVEGLGLVKEVAEDQLRVDVATAKGLETWIISLENGEQTVKKMYWYEPDQPLLWAPDRSVAIPIEDEDMAAWADVNGTEETPASQPSEN